jgi:uncharacterized membrane protein
MNGDAQRHRDEPFFMTSRRMESLADCIFAFAMTLLVINLGLPDSKSVHDSETIKEFLLHQAGLFDDYSLSFILLALYWLAHHQLFHFVKQTNRVFLFINVFVLMFSALIPLSTSIVAHYGHLQVASLVFHANLFIVGSLFYLSWLYADHRGLLEADAGRHDISMGKLRSLLTPAAAIVAALVSFVTPGWSSTVYVAIPLVLLLMRVRDKKRRAGD